MHGKPRAEGLRLRTVGATTVVELSGEIDILARPRLVKELDRLTGTPRPDLLLDLGAVSFMDCSGLAVLNRARLRTKQRGGRLRLVVTDPRIRQILRVTRLASRFDMYDDVKTALAGRTGIGVDRERAGRRLVVAP